MYVYHIHIIVFIVYCWLSLCSQTLTFSDCFDGKCVPITFPYCKHISFYVTYKYLTFTIIEMLVFLISLLSLVLIYPDIHKSIIGFCIYLIE